MSWIWPFAKKQTPPKRPEEGFFHSGIRDDYATSSVRQLTPAKLGAAIRAADEGDTVSQYEVFELVEQDTHVTSVSSKRRQAVTKAAFKLKPAVEDGKAQQAVDLCNAIIFGENGSGGIDNWSTALFDLTDAIGKAFALGQPVWYLDQGRWKIKRIERWPQMECILGDPSVWRDGNADEIRIITEAERVKGEALAPYQWICHTQKTWSVPLSRASLFRAITWFYLFKRFSLKDWAIFVEKYGQPLRMGKYRAGAEKKEQDALWAAVLSLGKDSACIVPDGNTIELIEAKVTSSGGGSLPHSQLSEYCNKEISKALMGSTMSVDPGDRGARSQGEVYERSEGDLAINDAQKLAETLRRDLLSPIVGFNLGWDVPVPLCEFVFEEKKDLNLLAQRDKTLVDMGTLIPEDYVYQTYNIPKPKEGEKVIRRPAAAPSPFGNSGNTDDSDDADDQSNALSALSHITLADVLALADSKKKSRAWATSMISSPAASQPHAQTPKP